MRGWLATIQASEAVETEPCTEENIKTGGKQGLNTKTHVPGLEAYTSLHSTLDGAGHRLRDTGAGSDRGVGTFVFFVFFPVDIDTAEDSFVSGVQSWHILRRRVR